jgi:hypothetical protein
MIETDDRKDWHACLSYLQKEGHKLQRFSSVCTGVLLDASTLGVWLIEHPDEDEFYLLISPESYEGLARESILSVANGLGGPVDDLEEDIYVGRATTPDELKRLLSDGRVAVEKLRTLAKGQD